MVQMNFTAVGTPFNVGLSSVFLYRLLGWRFAGPYLSIILLTYLLLVVR